MPEITLLPSPTSESQKRDFERAATGLRKQGVNVKVSLTSEAKTKAVACWGWRRGDFLRRRGHDVLVFERGYLGDRFSWTSIGWNGLNGRANMCVPANVTPERFEQHFELKPWNKNGEKIIIMGQVRGDMSLSGKDLTEFYNCTARHLWEAYRKHIYFRPHPAGIGNNRNFTPRLPILEGDLNEALKDAFLVVTFNSNSGVDAVINGVPALSFDAGSMAYEVTGHAVYDRIFPAREKWAHRLAHCQWSPEEIERGDYWQNLKAQIEG